MSTARDRAFSPPRTAGGLPLANPSRGGFNYRYRVPKRLFQKPPQHRQFGRPMNDWEDAERRVEKAQELFEQRRWLEALEELRAATSINPYNASWFFNIGLTLDEMERYEEAIEAYRHALGIDERDLQALHHLGMDLHRVGNFDEALKTFEQIESIDSSYEPAYCQRILTYTELGDHEKAEE